MTQPIWNAAETAPEKEKMAMEYMSFLFFEYKA